MRRVNHHRLAIALGLSLALGGGLVFAINPGGLFVFQAGSPIRADELNANFSALETTLESLSVVVSRDCPRGYSNASSSADFQSVIALNPEARLCVRGADEMVRVGPVWVDRYESAVADTATFAGGLCNGQSAQFYGQLADDYGPTFPDSGNWSVPLYACSKKAVVAASALTWYQASQVCLLAGKKLISNDEWQWAVAGTVDPGTSQGPNGECHTALSPLAAPYKTRRTGLGTKCRSRWGAEDMIGNHWEMTAPLGMRNETAGWVGQPFLADTAAYGANNPYGDNQDAIWDQSPAAGAGNFAVTHRGGSYNAGSAGAFAVLVYRNPSVGAIAHGFRCSRPW